MPISGLELTLPPRPQRRRPRRDVVNSESTVDPRAIVPALGVLRRRPDGERRCTSGFAGSPGSVLQPPAAAGGAPLGPGMVSHARRQRCQQRPGEVRGAGSEAASGAALHVTVASAASARGPGTGVRRRPAPERRAAAPGRLRGAFGSGTAGSARSRTETRILVDLI